VCGHAARLGFVLRFVSGSFFGRPFVFSNLARFVFRFVLPFFRFVFQADPLFSTKSPGSFLKKEFFCPIAIGLATFCRWPIIFFLQRFHQAAFHFAAAFELLFHCCLQRHIRHRTPRLDSVAAALRRHFQM